MLKNILATIGVLALIAGGVALAVFKPWEKADVVAADSAVAPAVYFDALREDGVTVERVHADTKKNKAVLYVSYAKFFKSPTLLRAFDARGKELGRAKRALSGDREDAGYADFQFDERVPLKSATFFILTKSDVEPAPAEEIAPAEVVEETIVAEPVSAPAPDTVPAQ